MSKTKAMSFNKGKSVDFANVFGLIAGVATGFLASRFTTRTEFVKNFISGKPELASAGTAWGMSGVSFFSPMILPPSIGIGIFGGTTLNAIVETFNIPKIKNVLPEPVAALMSGDADEIKMTGEDFANAVMAETDGRIRAAQAAGLLGESTTYNPLSGNESTAYNPLSGDEENDLIDAYMGPGLVDEFYDSDLDGESTAYSPLS